MNRDLSFSSILDEFKPKNVVSHPAYRITMSKLNANAASFSFNPTASSWTPGANSFAPAAKGGAANVVTNPNAPSFVPKVSAKEWKPTVSVAPCA